MSAREGGFRHDLGEYVRFVGEMLKEYAIGDGLYQRHILRTGHATEGCADAYGTADAVNIMYTLGQLPNDADERAALRAGICSFQEPESGIFRDPTHSDIHTTAHCVAALELLDARPTYPLTFLQSFVEIEGELERFLDHLDWNGNPWRASHDGAGIYAALSLTGEANDAWSDRYFAWLSAEVSAKTGLWRRKMLSPMEDNPGLFGNMAGTFHYHFNFVSARLPLPYPERVIDTCLDLLDQSPVDIALTDVVFKDIDWIFCVNRAERESGYRRPEVVAALLTVSDRIAAVLTDTAHLNSERFDDLHDIFGGLCAVAELQQALPGTIRTPRPLRLVLDRRPFI